MVATTEKTGKASKTVKPSKAERFVKQMLMPGTYISPDGVLEVTAERLKGWAESHKKMKAAGYIVPSKWDHGKKLEDLSPLQQDVFKSSKNTVGKLVEFNVSGDGSNGAEIVMEISDPIAAGRCKRNEIEVSPVILGEFRGGKGDKYQDIIGHVDLVDYAVDRSQTAFSRPAESVSTSVVACSLIRMSSSKSIFRLSSEDAKEMEDEDRKKMTEENESESEDASDDKEGGDESTDEEQADEIDTEAEAAEQARMVRVIDLLKAHDIALAPDVTKENLLDHLESALGTSAKKDGIDVNESGVANDDEDQNAQAVVADPGYVSMSSLKKFAETSYSKDIAARLDRCLKSGRCTPAEHKAKTKDRGTIRLSLAQDGAPKSNSLTLWLESREALRENSAFDATAEANKSQLRMSSSPSGVSVAQPGIADGHDPNDPAAVRKQQIELANRVLAGAY